MPMLLQNPVDLAEKIAQQLIGVGEFIRNATIPGVAMPVVVGIPVPGMLELLRRLHRVRVVVAENPRAIGFMSRPGRGASTDPAMTAWRKCISR